MDIFQHSSIRLWTTFKAWTVLDLWIRANSCKLPTLAYRSMLKGEKKKKKNENNVHRVHVGVPWFCADTVIHKLCVCRFTHKVSHSAGSMSNTHTSSFSKSNIVLDCGHLHVCVCACVCVCVCESPCNFPSPKKCIMMSVQSTVYLHSVSRIAPKSMVNDLHWLSSDPKPQMLTLRDFWLGSGSSPVTAIFSSENL